MKPRAGSGFLTATQQASGLLGSEPRLLAPQTSSPPGASGLGGCGEVCGMAMVWCGEGEGRQDMYSFARTAFTVYQTLQA